MLALYAVSGVTLDLPLETWLEMTMKNLLRISLIGLSISAVLAAQAQRKPTVTYTVSGSAGNWSLNFNVQNNMLPSEGYLYFFGVELDSGRNITGSPNANWNPNRWASWDNSGYGGSNTIYNNNWINQTFVSADEIAAGTSQNGFVAVSTDAIAPTSVNFFAFGAGGTYGGNDNFNGSGNPGFEGIATQSVPEPMSLIALGTGALALLRRRRIS